MSYTKRSVWKSGTDNGCDRRLSAESEEEFRKSYDFVDSIRFYETHIFKYSRRQGTKAAAMDGQLTEAEKSFRSEKMIELHHRHAAGYMRNPCLAKTWRYCLRKSIQRKDRNTGSGHTDGVYKNCCTEIGRLWRK